VSSLPLSLLLRKIQKCDQERENGRKRGSQTQFSSLFLFQKWKKKERKGEEEEREKEDERKSQLFSERNPQSN
jgi:hypothetical protein